METLDDMKSSLSSMDKDMLVLRYLELMIEKISLERKIESFIKKIEDEKDFKTAFEDFIKNYKGGIK